MVEEQAGAGVQGSDALQLEGLTDLIGELSTRSEDFRHRSAAHDVRYHRTGRKRFHHPLVGDLDLDYEAFELPGDPGQRINVYTAPPDSPTDQALRLLASWVSGPPAAINTASSPQGQEVRRGGA